jgi:uncharacterized protein YigA (DUF484 family)
MSERYSGRAESDKTGPSADEVARYLKRHPEFLAEHAELLIPADHQGDNIVDFQQIMTSRLRDELDRLKGQQRQLLAISRLNLNSQQRVHAGVLTLIAATSFEHLIQIVTTDLAVLLDVDVVTLCIEAGAIPVRAPIPGIQILGPGDVDDILGPGRDARLEDEVRGDPLLFGGGAGLVRSEALLRLPVRNGPPGLVALGARKATKFRAGQGTELLCFLARALGITIGQWLDL